MKEEQHIDDIFKDQLKDYELDPPMHLWGAIAEASSPADSGQQRRKPLAWWWPLLSLAWLLLFLALWPLGTRQGDVTSTPTLPSAESSAPPSAVISAPVEDTRATAALPPANINKKTALVSSSGTAKSGMTALPTKEKTSTKVTSTTRVDVLAEENITHERPAVSSFRLDLLHTPLPNLPSALIVDSLTFSLPKARSWRTTVDFMASMDFVLRSLEAKDAAYAAYAKRRDDTETFRHGISFGMRLSTVSDNGFAVRSGLNYSTINEQLNLKIGEEERLIAQVKYAEDGSIIGTDTTLAVVGTYRIVNNRYTELDIPLLVGYEYAGKKVSLSFNGGVLINMLSAQRGAFLSPNTDESVSFSSADPTSYRAFRNRLGIGFYGSMGVYFQVNENLQFLLEPYLKWRPGSYTVDGYILDQRYTTTGLFVGMRKEIY